MPSSFSDRHNANFIAPIYGQVDRVHPKEDIMTTLTATKRNLETSTKALRRQGQIIGNIYGKGITPSIPIQLPEIETERFLRANQKGSQAIIMLGKDKMHVILKEVSFDSLNHKYNDVAFQALIGDEMVTNTAPIDLLNIDDTLGLLTHNLSEIEYKAKPDDLFDKIEIDVAKLPVGTKLYVRDLDVAKNKNIEILTPMDECILHIAEKYATEEIEEAAEAAEK